MLSVDAHTWKKAAVKHDGSCGVRSVLHHVKQGEDDAAVSDIYTKLGLELNAELTLDELIRLCKLIGVGLVVKTPNNILPLVRMTDKGVCYISHNGYSSWDPLEIIGDKSISDISIINKQFNEVIDTCEAKSFKRVSNSIAAKMCNIYSRYDIDSLNNNKNQNRYSDISSKKSSIMEKFDLPIKKVKSGSKEFIVVDDNKKEYKNLVRDIESINPYENDTRQIYYNANLLWDIVINKSKGVKMDELISEIITNMRSIGSSGKAEYRQLLNEVLKNVGEYRLLKWNENFNKMCEERGIKNVKVNWRQIPNREEYKITKEKLHKNKKEIINMTDSNKVNYLTGLLSLKEAKSGSKSELTKEEKLAKDKREERERKAKIATKRFKIEKAKQDAEKKKEELRKKKGQITEIEEEEIDNIVSKQILQIEKDLNIIETQNRKEKRIET